MFCTKCGTELADDAAFCTNCGVSISGESTSKVAEKIVDDTVVLNVKPTYSFGYKVLPAIITLVIFLFFIGIPALLSGGFGGFLIAFIGIFVFLAIFLGIPMLFNKIQYKHYSYDFYKTKVTYKDSFLNVSEKEVKYKYIREVTLQQSFIQRWFNIGNIILYTNAETGFGNGIFIRDVKDVKDVYNNIKNIINV